MKLPIPKIVKVITYHKELNNLKILHLSDLHINKKTSNSSLAELVNICNNLDCDFVVITGDIIDTKVKDIKEKLKILNSLQSIVYYVSGNHDLFYGIKELVKELDNFIYLDNKNTVIYFNEKKIYIAGLADRFSKLFGIQRDINQITTLMQKEDATIFLAHQPKDYKIALKANASLFLCGHTHGGQIFPFHYLVRLTQPFLKGLHYKNETAIYVNSGLGTWGIHHRFKAPCEITILNLSS